MRRLFTRTSTARVTVLTSPAPQPAVPAYPAGSVEALWAADVATPRGALPGAQLLRRADLYSDHPERASAGQAFTVQFAAGQTLSYAQNQQAAIARALRVPAWTVLFDAPFWQETTGRARLLLLDETMLDEPVPWPGPNYDSHTGILPVGVHADGGPALWRLRNGARAQHGLILGGPVSGASTLAATILASAANSDDVVPWVIDRTPYTAGLCGQAEHYATRHVRSHAGALELLAAAERIVAVRGDNPHDPEGPNRPLLLLVIAAAEELLADQPAARQLDRLMAYGPRLGLSIQLQMRSATLMAFGDLATLRANACASNVAVLPGVVTPPLRPLSRLAGDSNELPVQTRLGVPYTGLGYLNDTATRFRAYDTTNFDLELNAPTELTPLDELSELAAAGGSCSVVTTS